MEGQRFSRLVVVRPAARDKRGNARWHCHCDCGGTATVQSGALRNGHTKSCGCLHREKSTKHGKVGHRVYEVWNSMRDRCLNANHPSFACYGGRGINVCERWHKIENFVADMGDPPDGMSLDRIDNDGNYEPSNCRWATRKQQSRNTRQNVVLVHRGQTLCVTEWAEIIGVPRETIYTRLRRGWSVARALTKPTHMRDHNAI